MESLFYLYLKDRNFEKDNLEKTLKGIGMILEKYGSIEIEKVDTQLLSQMQTVCFNSGNKGATVRRKMAIIKAMLNWAHRNGLLTTLPSFPVCPTSETKRYVPPSPEEIAKIYQVAPPHLQRVIILGFMFGMRVGKCEMLQLRWRDVDLQQAVIRVPNAKKGIGEPWRDVPIRASLLSIIKGWQDEDKSKGVEYVIHYKGKPVKKILHCWNNAVIRAGIGRHIRPYDLRHAFATEAIASGANYGLVASLMGHRSPLMILKHYQHVNSEQKKAAMENIPQPHFSNEACMTKTV